MPITKREGERMDPFAAEEVEHHHYESRSSARSASVRLSKVELMLVLIIDRGQPRALALGFANPVEHHNRIVERITDHGQQRGDHRKADLELIDQQEAECSLPTSS
jgi:hypothetical protein